MAFVRVFSVLPLAVTPDGDGGLRVAQDADLAFPFPEWVLVQTRANALCYQDDGTTWNPDYLAGSDVLPPLVCPTRSVVEFIGKRYALYDTYLDDRVYNKWLAAWPSMTSAWIATSLEDMLTNLIARRQDLMASLPAPMRTRIRDAANTRQEIRTILGELSTPVDDDEFTGMRAWMLNQDDDGEGKSEPWDDLPVGGRARLRAWGTKYDAQGDNHPTKLMLRLNELRLISMVVPALNQRLP